MMRDDEFDQLLAMFHQGQEPLRFDDGGGAFDGVGMSGFDGVGNVGDGNEGGNFDFASLDSLSDATGSSALSSTTGQANTSLNEMQNLDRDLSEVGKHDLSTEAGLAAASAALGRLSDAGYGGMTGLFSGNPTSSIDNLLAVQNVNSAAPYAVSMFLSAVPGANLALGAARGFGALSSGQMSLGQALAYAATGKVASELGVNPNTAVAMLEGNYGKAAATTAAGLFSQGLASLTGASPGVISGILGMTGISGALGRGVEGAVNTASSGASVDVLGQIGKALDNAFGTSGGTGSTSTAGVQGGAGTADGVGSDIGSANTSVAADTTSKASTSGAASLLPMIAALGAAGLESDEDKDQYRNAAQIGAVSPFGSMPYSG